MNLLTKAIRDKLFSNSLSPSDNAPVLKLFNPVGAATWLFCELDADGDTLFGLCDLGFGSPEMGYASLSEIAAIRLSFGLKIERDMSFSASHPLTVYALAAARNGAITESEAHLASAVQEIAAEKVGG